MKCTARKKVSAFPCGNCVSCTINARRVLTARLLLEAQAHRHVTFVTWTYSEDGNGSLVREDFRKYLAVIRTQLHRREMEYRYFAVGEYGDQTGRPHYHAILYGLPREGLEIVRATWLSRSHADEKVGGFVRFDLFSRDLAAYITGYVSKKWHKRDDHFANELRGREREFVLASRHPGIGASAIRELHEAVVSEDGKLLRERDGDVPEFARFGGRLLPLGRFLREKLRSVEGLSNPRLVREAGQVAKLEKHREKVESRMQALPENASVSQIDAWRAEASRLEKENQEKLVRITESRNRFRRSLELVRRRL